MMVVYNRVVKFTGFDWDEGNAPKLAKHGVEPTEVEEVFLSNPLTVEDESHSRHESRFHSLGLTKEGRGLMVVWTPRGGRIRPISARPMNRKERGVYEQATEADS